MKRQYTNSYIAFLISETQFGIVKVILDTFDIFYSLRKLGVTLIVKEKK